MCSLHIADYTEDHFHTCSYLLSQVVFKWHCFHIDRSTIKKTGITILLQVSVQLDID